MALPPNLIGQRFGKLIVLGRLPNKSNRPAAQWACKCDCGLVVARCTADLRARHDAQSCGQFFRVGSCLNPDEACFRSLFRAYKKQAEYRSISFSLAMDEFRRITKKNCFYCGLSPSTAFISALVKRRGQTAQKPYIYNGVDRKDNNIGYDSDNVLTCCSTCNHAKHVMPYEVFMAWVSRLVQYQAFGTSEIKVA